MFYCLFFELWSSRLRLQMLQHCIVCFKRLALLSCSPIDFSSRSAQITQWVAVWSTFIFPTFNRSGPPVAFPTIRRVAMAPAKQQLSHSSPSFTGYNTDAFPTKFGLQTQSMTLHAAFLTTLVLAVQQPLTPKIALRLHGLCAFPCGFLALSKNPLLPACRHCFQGRCAISLKG